MMIRLGQANALGLITCVSETILSITSLGNRLEEKLDLAMLFSLKGSHHPPIDVLIVSIDRVSADMLNLPEDPKRWPRSILAQLTDTTQESQKGQDRSGDVLRGLGYQRGIHNIEARPQPMLYQAGTHCLVLVLICVLIDTHAEY